MPSRWRVRAVLVAAGIVLGLAGSARAQAIGQIFGKVVDATGAVLPGVTVTVSGGGLQQPLTGVTTPTGAYSFPSVPIGTYTLTFELSGFKKVSRPDVIITTGFSAMIDAKLEVGGVTQEVSVTAASPIVDTKKTNTGGTFTLETLNNLPTGRDPFQIANLAPGVTLSGVNVGGAASNQQLGIAVYGSQGSVQWNMEGGNITDVSSNSSALYYNFDSFQEVQVVTGGGDVSVQSSGLFINLVTKSGSNLFKGSMTTTYENTKLQSQNVTEALFNAAGSNGTGLSGNPLHNVGAIAAEYGGPIKKNKLWFWGNIDRQEYNVGIANFFDTSKPECVPPPTTFARLDDVQKCLVNDETTIQDLGGKINFQLNQANRFQFLFTTDNKIRNHRDANASTAPEATVRQYSPGGYLADFTPQITHTLILGNNLVFTNQATWVNNIFSLDFTDTAGPCGESKPGRTAPSDPTCQWNTQSLTLRSPSYTSRGPSGAQYFERPTVEVKTDGNYFLSHFLGGDHNLKFGVGYRSARTLSFTHYGGGANVTVQCVGNVVSGCGGNQPVAVGSGPGIVPYQAVLRRDSFSNTRWTTFSTYIQDSYGRGRWRINGGLRQDWQTSKFLGGCVGANVIRPDLLPQQCQGPANPNHPFNNFSPRVSAIYDLRGNGKTAIHSSFSYYFATRVVLAGNLSNLGNVNLTWGPNLSSGACSTVATAPCWTDANHDNVAQANELRGTPTSNSARFDPATGILSNVLPIVDSDLKIDRTREGIVGIDHEVLPHVHMAVDFIYRKYDLGTATYNIGYQPACATSTQYPCTGLGFPESQLYSVRNVYTDSATGTSAPYYTVCPGCTRPSGAAGTTITGTDRTYRTYKGVTAVVEKRLSNRWSLTASYTYNHERQFQPYGSYRDPQGIDFTDTYEYSVLGSPRHQFKMFGTYQWRWGISVAGNLGVVDGSIRSRTINGPGSVYGGTTGTISRSTLSFEPLGTTRFPTTKILDVSVSKEVQFPGNRVRATLTLDGFNLGNVATITNYSSNNLNSVSYTAVSAIVAPRVFRIGVRLAF